jgi:hypothetical protein
MVDAAGAFLLQVLLATLTQLGALLGMFFIIGFLIYHLERRASAYALTTVGWKGILWTAWLGTPVHEFGHVVFCWVFAHCVLEVRLFEPDSRTGVLGYVSHSHRSGNAYQEIGNLFIGAGPLILGCVALALGVNYLVPNGQQIIRQASAAPGSVTMGANLAGQLSNQAHVIASTLRLLFHPANFASTRFWLFLYGALCIASHIAPSSADLRGMWSGLAALAIFLFVVDAICLLVGVHPGTIISSISSYGGMAVGMFMFGLVMALVNVVVTYVVLSIYWKLRAGRWLRPI